MVEIIVAGVISAFGSWATTYYVIEPYFPQNEKQQVSYLEEETDDE